MPYRRTIFIEDGYYHIFNRGNRKNKIFLDDQDRGVFLQRVKKYRKESKISVLCFVFMPNHFHFLIKQNGEEQVSKFMHKMLTSYSMYFNKKYDTVGRLFQGPFKAKMIETDEYLLHLSRYIHLHPSELGIKKLNSYQWSSYPDYLDQRRTFCEPDLILSFFSKTNPKLSYKEFVESAIIEKLKESLSDLLLE